MSKHAHTPGPWTQEGFAVKSPKGDLIFHTGFGLLPVSRSEEAEANARLIAAAPNLLAACKWVYELMAKKETNGAARLTSREALEVEVMLSSAIRKATGKALDEQTEGDQDQCAECDQVAVGYSEGTPYCAAHYRSRPSLDGGAA